MVQEKTVHKGTTWVILARVLERTGAAVHAQGAMYKAVAQSVLLYGRKSWMVTG